MVMILLANSSLGCLIAVACGNRLMLDLFDVLGLYTLSFFDLFYTVKISYFDGF